MGRHVSIAIRMAIVTIIVFGVLYPLGMTGIAQVLFPRQANGSLVREHGKVVGSELIGQQFVGAGYFHPRPSAAGKGYDATSSGGSNLGPTSKALADTVTDRSETALKQNSGLVKGRIPVDMVTASASGLDSDISVANAYAQVSRVAKARALSDSRVKGLVDANVAGRTLGFLGEPRVNVLQINRAFRLIEWNRKMTENRGKLKIFLGAVAGVGKTYKMLSEARRRVSRGEDIVVGLIETHGRPATTEQMSGFEQIPLKKLDYRGTEFYELDTAAVIARRPEWVLVDELAHTNVPGTVHAKRWQSIEEIRDAGINVITTLNIQHVESLNDIVHEITGVRVRETVPDWVLDTADEVELVDLTPDALLNRLRRGDIYKQEKIPQALANFFRKGNIVALRELALQRTAEEVDEQLHEYMEAHDMAQGKLAREHVLVCIAPRPMAQKLVRRGYRIAKRMHGTFDVVFVRPPGASLTKREKEQLQCVYELARNFGGKVVELEGDSVANEIVHYAGHAGATAIVMGQSARSRLQEVVKGSIINRIMRKTKDIDIIVVADSEEDAVC